MTIYDIASEAGVSITTVSRVLNHPKKVKEATRKKVEAVLQARNYSPNSMARGLVHNSMKTIGVLMSDIKNLHFSRAAYVLESIFFNWDYSTLLCNAGDDLEKKKKYIRILAGKKVDALVLLGSVFNDVQIERMICDYLPNTPVIISNSSLSIPNAHSVLTDHTCGMDLAVSHLIDRGHSEICFIRSNYSVNTQRKIAGFLTALKSKNLPLDENQNIYLTKPAFQDSENFSGLLAGLKSKFSAFIFIDDSLAIAGVNVLKNHGARIPDDVAVIGHDNSVFSLCCQPKLTSIDTKIEKISTVIAYTLHDIFLKNPVGNSILLRPELIIREST